MKRAIISILALAVAGVCSAEEQKIKLAYSTDKTISQMTGPYHWVNSGDNIKVCGKEYRVESKYLNRVCTLGIDADDDGKISSKETTKFKLREFKPFGISFKTTVAGEERKVPVVIYEAWPSEKGVSLRYRSAWGMSGKIDGQTVYFVNNPHEDKFSEQDTFYTSKSLYLVPLRPNIFINGKFYSSSINNDGTEITLNEVEQGKFGKFSFKSNMKACKCLILANENWSFDLTDPTIKTVPEDTFEILNCRYGTKGAMMANSSEQKTSMTFKADNENVITIGAPFIYYVKATLRGDSVEVEPTDKIMGSGGEIYNFEGVTGKVPPTVMIFTGRKCASKGRMEFG